MVNSNYPVLLGFMNSMKDTTTRVLTRDVLYGWTKSDKAHAVMAEIERAEGDEAKQSAKHKLPVALYMAQCSEGGRRPKAADAKLTYLCMHDFDHMADDPRAFYESNVDPRKDELHIVLAHITPRGEGLRLVTELQKGETIAECQERVATLLGLERDTQIKDASRISFIPSEKYFLYIDEAKLFDRVIEVEEEEEKAEKEESSTPSTAAGISTPQHTLPFREGQGVGSSPLFAQETKYQGIPYARIIEEVLKQMTETGKPDVGKRNNTLYSLVLCIRPLTGINTGTVTRLVEPYFEGLSHDEISKTVASALFAKGSFTISKAMQILLNELRQDCITGEAVSLPTITTMPKIMQKIVDCYPAKIREAVILSSLSMLGTYSTYARAKYLDNSIHSTTIFAHTVAKWGRGKGYMSDLQKKLLSRLQEEDDIVRDELEDARLEQVNAANQGGKIKRNPKCAPRFLGEDTTTVTMYKYLDALKGKHAIVFSEEITQLITNSKGCYGDLKSFFLKGFDNARMTHETASNDTPNYVIPEACINFCTSSTFENTLKFFTLDDGMASRVAFTTFPSKLDDKYPVYLELKPKDQAMLDDVITRLMSEGGGEKVFYNLPKLRKAIDGFIDTANAIYRDGADAAYRQFANRAAVIGFRAGLLAYLIEGHHESKTVIEFALQVANYVRELQYILFGKQMNKSEQTDIVATRQGANKSLLSEMPSTFTRQDIKNVLISQGRNPDNVRTIVMRWKENNQIREEDGVITKLCQLTA